MTNMRYGNTSLWKYMFIPIPQNLIYPDKETPVQVSISTNNLFVQCTQNLTIPTHLHNPLTMPMHFCDVNTMLGPSDKYIPHEQSAGPSENNCESSGQSWMRTVQNRPQDKGHRLATMSTTSAWRQ